jgi:thioredoxin 1
MALTILNTENFEREVIQSELPVIIDFWAPWCGPCQLMGPTFEELSEEYEGKLKFAKLNTDEEHALASQFGIQGIPSLVLTKDGKEVGRIVGFAPKEILKQKIEEVLAKI